MNIGNFKDISYSIYSLSQYLLETKNTREESIYFAVSPKIDKDKKVKYIVLANSSSVYSQLIGTNIINDATYKYKSNINNNTKRSITTSVGILPFNIFQDNIRTDFASYLSVLSIVEGMAFLPGYSMSYIVYEKEVYITLNYLAKS